MEVKKVSAHPHTCTSAHQKPIFDANDFSNILPGPYSQLYRLYTARQH